MAIPVNALVWPETMDPYDVVDYTVDVSNLLSSDSVSSFTIVPYTESTLLGLEVGTGSYAPSITGNIITVWLQVNVANQANPAFDGAGASLPLELSITTNSSPARKRQRTLVVKVAQR